LGPFCVRSFKYSAVNTSCRLRAFQQLEHRTRFVASNLHSSGTPSVDQVVLTCADRENFPTYASFTLGLAFPPSLRGLSYSVSPTNYEFHLTEAEPDKVRLPGFAEPFNFNSVAALVQAIAHIRAGFLPLCERLSEKRLQLTDNRNVAPFVVCFSSRQPAT